MADNTVLDAGAGGDTIATDEIGAAKWQMVKLAYGALDSATLVTTSAPLPVDIRAENASVTVDQSTGSNLHAVLDANSGVDIGDVDVLTITNMHSADYDSGAGTDTTLAIGIAVPASGGAAVVPGDATAGLKVDLGADNDVTVTGTVTANAGTNLDTSALLTTAAHDAAFGTAGTADAQVRTVQGIASMTPLLVDATGQGDVPITLAGETVLLTANDGTDIGDVDVATFPTTVHSADYDTGAGTDTTLTFGIAVPASGGAAVVPGDGTAGLKVDLGADNDVTLATLPDTASSDLANIRAAVEIIDNPVFADDAAFTLASSSVSMAGAIRDDTLSTLTAIEGDAVPLRVSSTGALHVTGGGGGTEYTEDAAAAADPIGGATILVRADTPATVTSTDGDNIAARATNYGAQYVQVVTSAGAFVDSFGGSGGTAMNDDAAFTVGTTQGTPAFAMFDDTTPDSVDENDAGILRMSANRNLYTTLRDAAGNERGVNVTAGNALTVDGSATTQPVSGTVTVSSVSTSITPGTAAGNLGKAEDAAHSSGDTGVMSLAVRNDTLGALAGTSGDYAPLQVGATGALYVRPVGTAAGDLGKAEDAAHSSGDTGVMSLSVRQASATALAGTAGDYQPLITDGNGRLYGRTVLDTQTSGGMSIFRSLDIDETEEDVKTSAGQVYSISAFNHTAAPIYLKFYNATAATVVVGTTTPVLTFTVPGNADSDGAGFIWNHPIGFAFSTAICVAATTAIADADTGAPAANACSVNIGYA